MKYTILMLALSFILFSHLSCEKDEPLTANPKEELEAKLKAEVENNNLISISYCVVKNGKIVYSFAFI